MRRSARRSSEAKSIATDEDVFLQPWFLPSAIAKQIRRVLPNAQLGKMRYYFEDYGCIRCEKKDVMYGGTGFCEACRHMLQYRIKGSLKRRLQKVGEGRSELLGGDLDSAAETARRLIGQVKRR